jgi:mannitol-1-phosphate/altronate dehydrogenase
MRRSQGLPVPADEQGAVIRDLWARGTNESSIRSIVRDACSDESLWGSSLSEIPGFEDAVAMHLARMEEVGVRAALSQLLFRGAQRMDRVDARVSQ